MDGFKAPRGRPDPQNDRFSKESLTPHPRKFHTHPTYTHLGLSEQVDLPKAGLAVPAEENILVPRANRLLDGCFNSAPQQQGDLPKAAPAVPAVENTQVPLPNWRLLARHFHSAPEARSLAAQRQGDLPKAAPGLQAHSSNVVRRHHIFCHGDAYPICMKRSFSSCMDAHDAPAFTTSEIFALGSFVHSYCFAACDYLAARRVLFSAC